MDKVTLAVCAECKTGLNLEVDDFFTPHGCTCGSVYCLSCYDMDRDLDDAHECHEPTVRVIYHG